MAVASSVGAFAWPIISSEVCAITVSVSPLNNRAEKRRVNRRAASSESIADYVLAKSRGR